MLCRWRRRRERRTNEANRAKKRAFPYLGLFMLIFEKFYNAISLSYRIQIFTLTLQWMNQSSIRILYTHNIEKWIRASKKTKIYRQWVIFVTLCRRSEMIHCTGFAFHWCFYICSKRFNWCAILLPFIGTPHPAPRAFVWMLTIPGQQHFSLWNSWQALCFITINSMLRIRSFRRIECVKLLLTRKYKM